MIDTTILSNLESADYTIAYNSLAGILAKGKLNRFAFEEILSLRNKLIVGDFLEEYQFFSKRDLDYMRRYIISHLDHQNRLFVSDLIEFASYWEIELPYKKCLFFLETYSDFIEIESDNSCVLMALLDYISINIKLEHIKQIKGYLDKILNNPLQEQSCQVRAAFILFRITHKRKYLEDLIDLAVNTEGHVELIKNILEKPHNAQDYFDYHDLLHILISNNRNKGVS